MSGLKFGSQRFDIDPVMVLTTSIAAGPAAKQAESATRNVVGGFLRIASH